MLPNLERNWSQLELGKVLFGSTSPKCYVPDLIGKEPDLVEGLICMAMTSFIHLGKGWHF